MRHVHASLLSLLILLCARGCSPASSEQDEAAEATEGGSAEDTAGTLAETTRSDSGETGDANAETTAATSGGTAADTSGGSSSRGNASSTGAGDTMEEPRVCTPLDQADGGTPSGFERCTPTGAINRVEPVECLPTRALAPALKECGDCDEFAAPGFCAQHPDVLDEDFCHYDCTTDEDCGPGGACACSIEGEVAFNQCVTADCATNDDCETGCGLSIACGKPSHLACFDGEPECSGDGTCPSPGEDNGDYCAWSGSQDAWSCFHCDGR